MNHDTLPVVGFEGRYTVTINGDVISHVRSGRSANGDYVLKPMQDNGGYMKVDLSYTVGDRRVRYSPFVHRLVCEAFIGPRPSNQHQVNHKNGIKSDNRLENLEWITGTENIRHAWKHGLMKPQQGSVHGNAKLTEEQVEIIRGLCRLGVKQTVISRLYRVRPTLISQIHLRQAWKHVA